MARITYLLFVKSGLLLDKEGKKIKSDREQELLSPLKDVKSLPFNEGLGPLEDLLSTKKTTRRYDTEFTEAKKSKLLNDSMLV